MSRKKPRGPMSDDGPQAAGRKPKRGPLAPSGQPTAPYDADAEYGRMYRIGCLVVFAVFVVGSALIAYLWLR